MTLLKFFSFNDLTLKYGISEVLPNYSPNDLIARVPEINTIELARQTISQSEPDLKSLILKLEKETAINGALIDKNTFINNQLLIIDTQKTEFLKLYNDFCHQVIHIDKELHQLEQEKNKIIKDTPPPLQEEKEDISIDDKIDQLQTLKLEYQNNTKELQKLIKKIEKIKSDQPSLNGIDTTFKDFGYEDHET